MFKNSSTAHAPAFPSIQQNFRSWEQTEFGGFYGVKLRKERVRKPEAKEIVLNIFFLFLTEKYTLNPILSL
jgi:hypothetical protein